jgi:hypothetical protein
VPKAKEQSAKLGNSGGNALQALGAKAPEKKQKEGGQK